MDKLWVLQNLKAHGTFSQFLLVMKKFIVVFWHLVWIISQNAWGPAVSRRCKTSVTPSGPPPPFPGFAPASPTSSVPWRDSWPPLASHHQSPSGLSRGIWIPPPRLFSSRRLRKHFGNYNFVLELDPVLDLNFLFPWPRLFFLFSTMTQRIVKRLVSYHISHEDLLSVKLATRAR